MLGSLLKGGSVRGLTRPSSVRSSVSLLRSGSLRSRVEQGFTLVEIMVVVVIVGILAAISAGVYLQQQRVSWEATVKEDVSSNKAQMVNTKGMKLYVPGDVFFERGVVSDGNTLGYTVNNAHTAACTYSARKFGDGDVFAWHFSTETGQVRPGLCEPLDVTYEDGEPIVPGAEEPPEPEGPGNPETPGPGNPTSPTDPGNPGTPEVPDTPNEGPHGLVSNSGEIYFSTRVTTNTASVACILITVNSTSDVPIPWSITMDRSVAPLLNNRIGNAGQGDYRIEETDGAVRIRGNNVTNTEIDKTQTVSPHICVYGGAIGIDHNVQSAQGVLGAVQGSQWYASQQLTVKGVSEFYGPWTTEVDLGELIRTASQKSPSQLSNHHPSLIQMENIGGTRYRITLLHKPDSQYMTINRGSEVTISLYL